MTHVIFACFGLKARKYISYQRVLFIDEANGSEVELVVPGT